MQIEVASLKTKGEIITPEREKELYDTIKNRYDEQISPYYAASRIWVDAIIDPAETRNTISKKSLLLFSEMKLPAHFKILFQHKIQLMKAQVSLICSLFLFLLLLFWNQKKKFPKEVFYYFKLPLKGY